ncbi:YbjN domain-containing protein [Sphingopyxis sp. PET50]|uniref:YbjN domain-containing protein n=1 Tax=Sphingopyxis sp. PET50 TaxID=2976533 RepID=UPI0021AEF523|nr:YbjN domain-containing protein [Sphingopyxis sp. PET50]
MGTAVAASLTPVPAAAELVDAKSPKKIAALLESQGWQIEASADARQDPVLKASRQGEVFAVTFLNCENGANCRTLQLLMGFADTKQVPLDKLNEWNRDRRFARAYRDEEGDPVLAMDVDLDFRGLPRENVGELFKTWAGLMDSFRRLVRGS